MLSYKGKFACEASGSALKSRDRRDERKKVRRYSPQEETLPFKISNLGSSKEGWKRTNRKKQCQTMASKDANGRVLLNETFFFFYNSFFHIRAWVTRRFRADENTETVSKWGRDEEDQAIGKRKSNDISYAANKALSLSLLDASLSCETQKKYKYWLYLKLIVPLGSLNCVGKLKPVPLSFCPYQLCATSSKGSHGEEADFFRLLESALVERIYEW